MPISTKRQLSMLVTFFAMIQSTVAQESTIPPDAIDLERVHAQKYTEWISTVFWPSDNLLASNAVPLRTVLAEKEKLAGYLNTILRDDCRPSEETFNSRLKAVRAAYDENDALVLRYDISELGRIELKDMGAIYVTFLPRDSFMSHVAPASPSLDLDYMREYLRNVVTRLLQVPEVSDASHTVEVFVSNLDIGELRCGNITYGLAANPSHLPTSWYSIITWWSDGRNVALVIGRRFLENPNENLERVAGPPPNVAMPWKFGGR